MAAKPKLDKVISRQKETLSKYYEALNSLDTPRLSLTLKDVKSCVIDKVLVVILLISLTFVLFEYEDVKSNDPAGYMFLPLFAYIPLAFYFYGKRYPIYLSKIIPRRLVAALIKIHMNRIVKASLNWYALLLAQTDFKKGENDSFNKSINDLERLYKSINKYNIILIVATALSVTYITIIFNILGVVIGGAWNALGFGGALLIVCMPIIIMALSFKVKRAIFKQRNIYDAENRWFKEMKIKKVREVPIDIVSMVVVIAPVAFILSWVAIEVVADKNYNPFPNVIATVLYIMFATFVVWLDSIPITRIIRWRARNKSGLS